MLIDVTERSSGERDDEFKDVCPDVETVAERLEDKDLLIFDFSAKLLTQGVSVLLVSIDKGTRRIRKIHCQFFGSQVRGSYSEIYYFC